MSAADNQTIPRPEPDGPAVVEKRMADRQAELNARPRTPAR